MAVGLVVVGADVVVVIAVVVVVIVVMGVAVNVQKCSFRFVIAH